MKSAVFLINNYFLALAFLLTLTADETQSCDTKWIRLVYMMSCGRKKRESVWAQNNTYEDLPLDFKGAYRYFKEKEPYNPMLSEPLLYEILEDDDDSSASQHVPKLLLYNKNREGNVSQNYGPTTEQTHEKANKSDSVLITKLLTKIVPNQHFGIRDLPDQWNVEKMTDEKTNYRREIDKLIEECCRIPPVRTCNSNTFAGACK